MSNNPPPPVAARWAGHEQTEQVVVRVPVSLLGLLDAAAKGRRGGRSGVIRDALGAYLRATNGPCGGDGGVSAVSIHAPVRGAAVWPDISKHIINVIPPDLRRLGRRLPNPSNVGDADLYEMGGVAYAVPRDTDKA